MACIKPELPFDLALNVQHQCESFINTLCYRIFCVIRLKLKVEKIHLIHTPFSPRLCCSGGLSWGLTRTCLQDFSITAVNSRVSFCRERNKGHDPGVRSVTLGAGRPPFKRSVLFALCR